ncbi:alpha,alpha-trehalase [Lutibacter oceani]|uniref:Alpha,alpha-trehalase n=1 Tax=Lutibacter oceani TaxID=1853311 RepID=A0A3D9RUZ5_9FLAO|nr:trehalase family glycosidase [Lutibacter oceani]REE83308.1 alpha,alpha-trehalase [Lutibacter oceani]
MVLQINPTATLKKLLAQEDIDGDKRITVDDLSDKVFEVEQVNGKIFCIEDTYFLSNLLQELALSIRKGNTSSALISLDYIYEKPSHRISRLIREVYWDSLTRNMDKKGLLKVLLDEKVEQDFFYIYVPSNDKKAFDYYTNFAKEITKIKVVKLPQNITPQFALTINNKPGLLALALTENNNEIVGEPFVVPGGRFNEMYGWDSYFESVGLLIDKKYDLAKGMIENFEYQINHYGKILNANRSYYLTRTQPPFYSSMIKEYVEAVNPTISWISEKLSTAINEYENVWMVEGKRLTSNGLNRYYAEGVGFVFETEEGHFKEIIGEYAKKFQISYEAFETKYKNREIDCPELDEYFLHDRSLRESGHDTSNRLVNKCAHLNTVDLNALLYKYEVDFAEMIETYFKGEFTSINNKKYTKKYWLDKAEVRKKRMNENLWNQEKGMYFDYDFKLNNFTNFESATSFYPLWAKSASIEQAQLLVKNLLPLLTCKGGVVSCTEKSRGVIDANNPGRQWDYPYGWAPHQIMIWKGLLHYNFKEEAQELVYRWLWVITKNAVNYNGTIAEKYDVVNCTHKVDTEYGNVGTNFAYIPDGGFGWMNASYQYGISILSKRLINKLDDLVDPDELF